jgi:UDP-galactopyranose mutase
MYIEITRPQGEAVDAESLASRARIDLERCGILTPDDQVLTRQIIDIDYAYVLFDRHRQQYLPELIEFLAAGNVFTCGRYGEWDYYSMEDSILSGKRAAERAVETLRSGVRTV